MVDDSVTSHAVLKINPEYFRLRKPLDRKIYELARNHYGNQEKTETGIQKFYAKSGSTSSLKECRRSIKSLAKSK